MAAYGDTGSIRDYEYDHLVPLELGGATNDPRNLWPEPGPSPNPKDHEEDALHKKCATGASRSPQLSRRSPPTGLPGLRVPAARRAAVPHLRRHQPQARLPRRASQLRRKRQARHQPSYIPALSARPRERRASLRPARQWFAVSRQMIATAGIMASPRAGDIMAGSRSERWLVGTRWLRDGTDGTVSRPAVRTRAAMVGVERILGLLPARRFRRQRDRSRGVTEFGFWGGPCRSLIS